MQRKFIFVIVALLGAVLACNLPAGGGSSSRAEPTRVPTDMIEAWEDAFSIYQETGELSLTLSEGQLTQFIADQIELQPEPILTNPEVELRPGEMFLRGDYAVSGGIAAVAELVLEAAIGDDGTPEVGVVSGTVGFVPIPVEILETFNFTVNQVLTGEVSNLAEGFKLTGIEINEGELTITGVLE